MAAGDPTGADLCVGTTDGDTLPQFGVDAKEDRLITMVTPIELTIGVKYTIVIRALTAGGVGDCGFWQTQLIGDYANGSKYSSSNSGSIWSETASQDFWFKTYEDTNHLRDSHGFVAENVVSSLYGVNWQAQTFIASSTYTIDGIRLRLYREVGATPGTITVSIRATDTGLPGAPTNPSPSDSVDPNITLDETPLSWDASDPVADTYEIYFRKQGDDWDLVGVAQAGVEWTIDFGTLAYGTTYQWKIDATNVYGTTPGTIWSFTTISFGRILVSYVLIPGGSGAGPYDDPPGTEGTDWAWTGGNAMLAVRRLVVAINNKIWYEIV